MFKHSSSTMRLVLASLILLAGAGAVAAERKPAGMINLNDTGLTECASPTWQWSGDCAGTGQDGEVGADALNPDPSDGVGGFRFAKVCDSGLRAGEGDCPVDPQPGHRRTDWACTLDLTTGALWELKTSNWTVHDYRKRFTHKRPGEPGYGEAGDASWLVAVSNAKRLCGYHDWQVPNIHALHSLVHYGKPVGGTPMIDNDFFPNTAWWVYAAEPSAQVSFQLGWATAAGWEDAAVRLVRTPVRQPDVRFTVSADGSEVTDNLTGLIWQRCVVGQQWDGQTCSGTPTDVNWYGAIDLGRAAGAPWRLPNIKELASTLSLKYANGPVPAFPGMGPYWSFWSSTPKRQQPTHAWAVWNSRGSVNETYDWTSSKVRLVR